MYEKYLVFIYCMCSILPLNLLVLQNTIVLCWSLQHALHKTLVRCQKLGEVKDLWDSRSDAGVTTQESGFLALVLSVTVPLKCSSRAPKSYRGLLKLYF